MNINRLTQKAQDAVIAAQTLAQRNGRPEIGTLHLLKALVDQPQGIIPQVLGRMGVDAHALDGAVTVHQVSDTILTEGLWYHVACVYTGEDLRIYLNGVQDGEPTLFRGPIFQEIGRASCRERVYVLV